jgi:heptosyltransferase III
MRPSRILIYRLGSLGDTVVALPCFHLIERAFPSAQRRVLTNLPVHAKAPAMSKVLGNSGLADSWLGYPIASRTPSDLLSVVRAVREWKPELLVYLAEPRRGWLVYRDLCFFRLCGVHRIIGAPLSDDLRKNQPIAGCGYLEYESQRLARCLSELGEPRLDDPASWDLRLNSAERQKADDVVSLPEIKHQRFLACSVGTKVEVKNWGEVRWSRLCAKLSKGFAGLCLVLVGSAEEAGISERVGSRWRGQVLNLCGKLTPRETAAVLQHAIGFIGQDSGPMHLAAAVGTPCTAVFSARNIPRVWFPYGEHHRIIYHRTPCAGCQLDRCVTFGKQCIESIAVDEVYTQAVEMLAANLLPSSESN